MRLQPRRTSESPKRKTNIKLSPIEVAFAEGAEGEIASLEREVWFGDAEKLKRYRADFVIETHKVAIELDGWQNHHTPKQLLHDAERERYIERAGYRVLRFRGVELTGAKANPQKVVAEVKAVLRQIDAEREDQQQRAKVHYEGQLKALKNLLSKEGASQARLERELQLTNARLAERDKKITGLESHKKDDEITTLQATVQDLTREYQQLQANSQDYESQQQRAKTVEQNYQDTLLVKENELKQLHDQLNQYQQAHHVQIEERDKGELEQSSQTTWLDNLLEFILILCLMFLAFTSGAYSLGWWHGLF
ncbi:DUF559 domain-containing protein [Anaerolineales bacterium HSG25]|nr:DUF559 domain-containing protein [Anaerolineales bacterium HSG25]